MVTSMAWAGVVQTTMDDMPWHNGGVMMGLHWIWWAFWVVVFLVLVIAFWRLFSDRAESRERLAHEEAAEEILRRRFAGGEIDEEEYVRRLTLLRETITGV